MARLGLLGTAALGAVTGAGEIAGGWIKNEQTTDLQKQLLDMQAEKESRLQELSDRKRGRFISEMDRMRQEKSGAQAPSAPADDTLTSDGLSVATGQTTPAMVAPKNRESRLTPEEIGMAALRTGNLDAKDYIGTTSRAETNTDKMTRLMALKLMQEDRRDARQVRSLDSREGISDDRLDTAEHIAEMRQGQGSELTLRQKASNREIDAARRVVGGLDTEDIRKRTAKFTNTGRDNPDYDASLANRLRLASKRKVGADDWYDQQNGLNEDDGNQVTPQAQPAAGGIGERFLADPAMKGNKLGNASAQGVEVLNAEGKIIGHYR